VGRSGGKRGSRRPLQEVHLGAQAVGGLHQLRVQLGLTQLLKREQERLEALSLEKQDQTLNHSYQI
jgi:hypothetical protein